MSFQLGVYWLCVWGAARVLLQSTRFIKSWDIWTVEVLPAWSYKSFPDGLQTPVF